MVAQGKSYAEIADTVGCTKGTITYTMKRYNEHETVRNLHRSGRKRLATARDERNLISIAKNKIAQNRLQNLPKNGFFRMEKNLAQDSFEKSSRIMT